MMKRKNKKMRVKMRVIKHENGKNKTFLNFKLTTYQFEEEVGERNKIRKLNFLPDRRITVVTMM